MTMQSDESNHFNYRLSIKALNEGSERWDDTEPIQTTVIGPIARPIDAHKFSIPLRPDVKLNKMIDRKFVELYILEAFGFSYRNTNNYMFTNDHSACRNDMLPEKYQNDWPIVKKYDQLKSEECEDKYKDSNDNDDSVNEKEQNEVETTGGNLYDAVIEFFRNLSDDYNNKKNTLIKEFIGHISYDQCKICKLLRDIKQSESEGESKINLSSTSDSESVSGEECESTNVSDDEMCSVELQRESLSRESKNKLFLTIDDAIINLEEITDDLAKNYKSKNSTILLTNLAPVSTYEHIEILLNRDFCSKYNLIYVGEYLVDGKVKRYAVINFINSYCVKVFYDIFMGIDVIRNSNIRVCFTHVQGFEAIVSYVKTHEILQEHHRAWPKLYYTQGEKMGEEVDYMNF